MPAAVLWAGGEAAAVNPARPLTQYSLSSWETRDGLPQNSVQSLAQTREGYLWVATVEGLARFDGFRFKVFDRTNTAALTRNDIQSLYTARDGSLWISAYGSGLLRHRDGVFRAYAPPGGWAASTVTAITEDARGALWIGTDGSGLFRLKDEAFERYPGREGLAGTVVTAMIEDAAGRLLAGTADGLHVLEGGRFRKAEGLSRAATCTFCSGTARGRSGSAPTRV